MPLAKFVITDLDGAEAAKWEGDVESLNEVTAHYAPSTETLLLMRHRDLQPDEKVATGDKGNRGLVDFTFHKAWL